MPLELSMKSLPLIILVIVLLGFEPIVFLQHEVAYSVRRLAYPSLNS